jgi:hypothetical protein
MMEFIQQWTTIMSEVRCGALKQHRAIQNNRYVMLTSGVMLLDNVCLHAAARTTAQMEHFNWK